MERIRSKYDVETVPFKFGDRVLEILQMKDFVAHLEQLVEEESVDLLNLPYWAKVWEASVLLAYFLGKQPVEMGKKMLEIGAGIGVVGIYAALCGHRVTITDVNEDALLFARANAILNGLPNADIRKLDWNEPDLPDRYDVIFGSEVIYDRKSYPLLVNFLDRALAPGGMIFLSKHEDLRAPTFFTELTKKFEFKQTVRTVHSDGEPQRICLYAIRSKKSG